RKGVRLFYFRQAVRRKVRWPSERCSSLLVEQRRAKRGDAGSHLPYFDGAFGGVFARRTNRPTKTTTTKTATGQGNKASKAKPGSSRASRPAGWARSRQ